MKKLFAYIFVPLVVLVAIGYMSAAPLTGDGIQGGSGTTAADIHVDDILTALGIASEATHFGSFTGSTITDNQTAKAAMQLLETAVETKAPASGIALSALANQAAQTINANATDGAAAPTAVAISASQVVARLAAGNIKGASTAEMKTLLGYYTSGDSPTFGTDTTTKQIYAAPTELTLSSNTDGNITATQTLHTVDTYDDQATGALDTIAAGTDGQVLYLRAAHTDRTVVLDETDNIVIPNGSQISLDSTSRWIALVYDAGLSKWVVVSGLPDAITISTFNIDRQAGDGTYSGNTMSGTAGETLAFGQPVYMKSDGKFWLADADAAATMPALGLVVVGGNAEATVYVLTHGLITETDWNWTVGATIYVADGTAGAVTATLADISDQNDVVQVVGIAVHADSIFVNPSLTTVVLAAP